MRTPSEIIVDPANIGFHELEAQTGQHIRTALFTESSQLGAVVKLALHGYDHGETFTYSSIGCSYGAELDSTAALLTNSGICKAAITGIDIDEELLGVAKQGEYLEFDGLPLLDYFRNRKLRKLGFETSSSGWGKMYISAAELRKQHEVDFQQADPTEGPLGISRQNLITCNNVLPLVGAQNPQKAREMATRLCGLVAPGGILSIAAEPEWFSYLHGEGKDIHSYGDLHRKMVATMRKRHGMEIALYDKNDRVAALRRIG